MELAFFGRIGNDAVIREKNSGDKFVAFNVAHSERYKNEKGEIIEKVIWVKCYGTIQQLGKVVNSLEKGALVWVRGYPSIHKWKNETTKQMEIDWRCTINKVRLLSTKKESDEKKQAENKKTETKEPEKKQTQTSAEPIPENDDITPNVDFETGEIINDDLPF